MKSEVEPGFVLATCSDPRVPYARYARALGVRVMPAPGADMMPDPRFAAKYLQRHTHGGKVMPLIFAAHSDCLAFSTCGGDKAAKDRVVEQAAYMNDAGVPSAAMMFRHVSGPEFLERHVWDSDPDLTNILNMTRSLAFDGFDWSYDLKATVGVVAVGSAFTRMEYPRVLRIATRAVRDEMVEPIARAIAHFRESATAALRLYISPEVSRTNADRVTAFFADLAVFPAECRQAAA